MILFANHAQFTVSCNTAGTGLWAVCLTRYFLSGCNLGEDLNICVCWVVQHALWSTQKGTLLRIFKFNSKESNQPGLGKILVSVTVSLLFCGVCPLIKSLIVLTADRVVCFALFSENHCIVIVINLDNQGASLASFVDQIIFLTLASQQTLPSVLLSSSFEAQPWQPWQPLQFFGVQA